MSLGVNDPTPLKGGQIDHQKGILSIATPDTSVHIDKKDDLVKFIQNIKQKPVATSSKPHDMGVQLEDAVVARPLDISHLAEGVTPFSTEYKPVSSVKSNVYSVNELLKLQQSVPEVVVNSILLTLPKKSFWRLAGRGHSEGRNNHVHNKENGHEKKGSRNRNSRNNGRRNNQNNNNNNRNHNHEALKEVSKDELLAMEEKLQPTGNSMADFEKWRAQVRELERKKKGLPSEVQQEDKVKPASSLSTFFNFKKEENTTFEELEPSEPRSATPKGSSSRFSSFFSNASISTASLVPEASGSSPGNASPESTAARTGDFRLMSLFNKDEKVGGTTVRSPSDPAASAPPTQEQSNFIQQQPTFAMQTPSTTEKSSQFFQSLMTKGKTPNGRQDQVRKTSAQQPSSSTSQPQLLEKISGTPSSIQQNNAPPGLAKANAPPGNVPNVPPPGFPMHFAHSHMLPPINGQIAMPPPGFQNFTMAPPPGMFNGSVVNSDQNSQGKGAVSQAQLPINRPDVQPGQQSKQQRPPLQDVTQHELQHDTSQDVQHMAGITSRKGGQQALPPQFINPPGNMPLPPMQGGQPQFNRQLPAGFAFYGQKMVPQHPAGFSPYGQNMIPQPPAAGFTPYGQNVSQPLPGFNPYGQSLPSQLQQQKK